MESFGWYARLFRRNTYTTFLGSVGALYTLAFLAMQLVRTVLWWRYRPYPLPSGPLPKVTVLIPAYNEGAMVEKAIYSVAASDYPADRLEIFCIDDGSKDDTWEIYAAGQVPVSLNELIRLIRFPENRGKREALYAGFTQGTGGEYFVSVDSDSVIEPATLKQIVAPLLQDPKIGGVAGNVKVYNRSVNLITRMLWCVSSWPLISCGPANPATASFSALPGPCRPTAGKRFCPFWKSGATRPSWAPTARSAKTGPSPTSF